MPRSLPYLLLAGVVLALLSLAVLPAAPTYDPWAWLIWGRELWSLDLSTAEGPAFKPLPVFVCALLAPLGDAAPTAWVLVARTGAFAAVLLSGALAWRLTGDVTPIEAPGGDSGHTPLIAAVLAGLAVVLTAGFVRLSAAGSSEGLLLAFALGALLAAHDRRWRVALALLGACCLVRVEAWPFALAAVAVRWPAARSRERAVMAACVVAVPALWFGPEWLGSGDPLRSGTRALVPNPGQPALADVPAWASLRAAAVLAFWPVLLGLAALLVAVRRSHAPPAALAPAAIGAAWVVIVAAMAQAGFSGEARYALPGVALIAVSGAVGLAAAVRGAPARSVVALAVVGVVVVGAVPRVAGLESDRAALAYQADLRHSLARAVAAAGGPEALARCGRPVTGAYRGPLVAWHLRVEKRRVAFAPARAGVLLAARLRSEDAQEPTLPPRARVIAAAGPWRIAARCPAPDPTS